MSITFLVHYTYPLTALVLFLLLLPSAFPVFDGSFVPLDARRSVGRNVSGENHHRHHLTKEVSIYELVIWVLVDDPTLEVHPLKHQGTAGRIWPSVNLKIAIFARFGTMPITRRVIQGLPTMNTGFTPCGMRGLPCDKQALV